MALLVKISVGDIDGKLLVYSKVRRARKIYSLWQWCSSFTAVNKQILAASKEANLQQDRLVILYVTNVQSMDRITFSLKK